MSADLRAEFEDWECRHTTPFFNAEEREAALLAWREAVNETARRCAQICARGKPVCCGRVDDPHPDNESACCGMPERDDMTDVEVEAAIRAEFPEAFGEG